MIVYGRNKIKYSLMGKALRTEGGSQDFQVKDREETLLARIYDKSLRGHDKEEAVRLALEGDNSALTECPVDILYMGGRFAGFLYYDYSMQQILAEDEADAPAEPAAAAARKESPSVPAFLIPVAEAIVFSLLVKFIFYPIYESRSAGMAAAFMAEGLVPIVLGCLALAVVYVKWLRHTDYLLIIGMAGAAAYGAGAAGIILLATLVIALVSAAVSVFIKLLPTLLVLAIAVWILKSMFGKGR